MRKNKIPARERWRNYGLDYGVVGAVVLALSVVLFVQGLRPAMQKAMTQLSEGVKSAVTKQMIRR